MFGTQLDQFQGRFSNKFNNILCKLKFLSHQYHLILYSYTVCLAIRQYILPTFWNVNSNTTIFLPATERKRERVFLCICVCVRMYARWVFDFYCCMLVCTYMSIRKRLGSKNICELIKKSCFANITVLYR